MALSESFGSSSGASPLSPPASPAPLEGSSVTYRAWSRSYVEMYTISHEWTIDNFIELDEEAQVNFRVTIEGNEELRFRLSLKPRYGEARDHVSLYVHNLNKKELKYSLVFNLITAEKEKKFTRRADTRVHQPNESWGFPKFCQRSDILEPTNLSSMLPDGTLTIHCEIGGFKRITTRSDFSRVREKFKCEALNDLGKDLNYAWTTMDHTDVILVCKGEEFPCHKFMLSARSDVFRAMFAHDMKESQESRVDLEETSPEVVRQFLQFLYTDNFSDKSFENVSQLLPLAEMYNVKRLSSMCGQTLLLNMNEANVSEIAVIGEVYKVDLLKAKSIEFISQYPERVMKTTGWKKLLREAPDVCSSVISRLSRVGVEREVVIKTIGGKVTVVPPASQQQ